MNHSRLSFALATLSLLPLALAACGSTSDESTQPPATQPDAGADVPGADVTEESAEEASTQPEAGLPEADPEAQTADPLCPDGLTCTDINDTGRLACTQAGDIPSDAQKGCADGPDCTGNFACRYTNPEKTESACVQNCGICPVGTQCMDVTGDGYLGCLDQGNIPDGAETGCHTTGGCDGNATCFYTNQEHTESVCIRNCSPCKADTCPAGKVCDGIACVDPPCTEGSCGDGEVCYEGTCIPDYGDGPGSDTVDCPNLPSFACDPKTEDCAELIQFDPTQGDGYIDYPENGETWQNQYRSWLRRDLVRLIQYAAAKVACKAKDWTFGNGGPVGLIDMSEQDGSIPGTSIGQPGHPAGTHTNGFDIDIAYYQVNTADNRARPVCDHYAGGADAYHCTKAPHLLDPWRTALFIGSVFESPNMRVLGVDGKVGPIVEMALNKLCQGGWIPTNACNAAKVKLAYEPTNEGYGWYYFHHHHFHVSFNGTKARSTSSGPLCLVPGCDAAALQQYLDRDGLWALPVSASPLARPPAR